MTVATVLVASLAVPENVVLAPAVVTGPSVPEVVTVEAGFVVSRVIASVAVALALATASRTSRHTVFAPSLPGRVWVTVPL